MATPGQFSVNITTGGVTFINSDDNKIQIRGQPLTVELSVGIVYPGTASLSIAGQGTNVGGIKSPGTASLGFTGIVPLLGGQVFTADPTTASLGFTGYAPNLGTIISPATTAVGITEYTPARSTGLKIEGFNVTLQRSDASSTSTGAISFASAPPNVSSTPPGSHTRILNTVALTTSGKIGITVTARVAAMLLGSLSYAGKTPVVRSRDKAVNPLKTTLGLAGKVPVVDDGAGVPIIIIVPPLYPQTLGTPIRNANATVYDGRDNVDQRTGFKVKPNQLVRDAYGILTRKDSADNRHPSDMRNKTNPERQHGALRPDDTGRERFIEDEFPGGVTTDDL